MVSKRLIASMAFGMVLLAACSTGNSGGGGGAGVACASGVKQTKVDIIGGIPTDPFGAAQKNGADQAAKDFCVSYQWVEGAHNTFPEEEAAGEAALASHPDGVGIVYFDKSWQPLIVDSLTQGAKVVLYNNKWWGDSANQPTDQRVLNLAYVGQDEHLAAGLVTQNLITHLKPNSTVLLIDPFPQVYVLQLRVNGAASQLKANNIPYETLNLDGSGDEGKYLSIVGPYLQAHPEINAVIGLGKPGANPAANYIQAHNLGYPIATIDTGAETSDYIQKGVITVAINQQPYLQGYYTVEELALWTKFGLRPADVNTGTFIVDKNNISEVLNLIKEGKG
jgi:simple sugar transport system substrate-binding protein